MNGGHLHSASGSQHNAMRPLGVAVNSDFRDYFTVKGMVLASLPPEPHDTLKPPANSPRQPIILCSFS